MKYVKMVKVKKKLDETETGKLMDSCQLNVAYIFPIRYSIMTSR